MITGQYFPIGSRVSVYCGSTPEGAIIPNGNYIQTINGLVPENEIKTYTPIRTIEVMDDERKKKRTQLIAELNRAKVSKNKHLEKELTKRLEALC
jgi:hypothetical protein